MPRIVGRTIGSAFRALSLVIRSKRNPASSMACAVSRRRWQFPATSFHRGSARRCHARRDGSSAATCSKKTSFPPGRSTRRISSRLRFTSRTEQSTSVRHDRVERSSVALDVLRRPRDDVDAPCHGAHRDVRGLLLRACVACADRARRARGARRPGNDRGCDRCRHRSRARRRANRRGALSSMRCRTRAPCRA